jgi:hypothetical protein
MAKAKGSVVVDLVKVLRKHKAAAQALLPPALAHYLGEKILVSSWYPLEDYIALLRATGRVLADLGPDVFEQMGRASARAHMDGTYRHLRDATGKRASVALLGSMYDTGRLEVVERAPSRAVLEHVDFAIPAAEVCATFTGYNAERMRMLGFEDVHVRHTECRAHGASACRWLLTWKGRSLL